MLGLRRAIKFDFQSSSAEIAYDQKLRLSGKSIIKPDGPLLDTSLFANLLALKLS